MRQIHVRELEAAHLAEAAVVTEALQPAPWAQEVLAVSERVHGMTPVESISATWMRPEECMSCVDMRIISASVCPL